MKPLLRSFSFLLGLASASACGGGPAEEAEPRECATTDYSSGGETGGGETGGGETSTVDAASPASGSGPLGRWLVVRSSAGGGLRVGSGVRLRADGFDVASGTLANATPGSCAVQADGVVCDVPGGPITATADAASPSTWTVRMGPLELGTEAAPPEVAAEFDARLAAAAEQRAACHAVATCCIDAENITGFPPCDLDALLGDRSTQSCRAAMVTVRTRLEGRSVPMPDSCR